MQSIYKIFLIYCKNSHHLTQKDNLVVDEQLEKIPDAPKQSGSASKVQFGRPIPPQQQVLLYSSDEWEDFILEWVYSQREKYENVQRFSGANDMGVDIAGFTDKKGVNGAWDNFQCKHYKDPLGPGIVAGEVAKVLWHSFKGHYSPPRKYYFVAPRGCSTKSTTLLTSVDKLREYIIKNWDKQLSKIITQKQVIKLDGGFKIYIEKFDLSIFSPSNMLEVVDDHRLTPYHAIRFGGGLPDRPKVSSPPLKPALEESRYIHQLFEAYGDYKNMEVTGLAELGGDQDLIEHFHRQREFFYHAEALRNFARDTVPTGTFEELQSEIHAGVVDVESALHPDGYIRLNAVTQTASQLQLTSNALISVVKVYDRKGICHQLANDDRLTWRKS